MSQSQHQQQQEPSSTITESKNKKKKYKRKRSNKSLKELTTGQSEYLEGAGDGILAKAAADTTEKRPLSTSMEDLQVSNSTTPVVSRKVAGSNWEAMIKKQETGAKHAAKNNETANDVENVCATPALTKSAIHRQKRKAAEQKYLAMDCEMVGVGLNGQNDMLARVSIVNKRGEVLLDKFVKPRETVTDYRTSVSGIRPNDILNGEEFNGVQNEVIELLQGKILVGHAISNDLAVLHIKHPYNSIRDTARYKPLCRLVANGRTPSLKRLSQAILGKEIQIGEHNSVEDARAAMSIYNLLAGDWEMYIKRHK